MYARSLSCTICFLSLGLGLLLLLLDVQGWVIVSSSLSSSLLVKNSHHHHHHDHQLQRRLGLPKRTFSRSLSFLSLSRGGSEQEEAGGGGEGGPEEEETPAGDEGCASEEECEIDWDSMPDFAEEEDKEDELTASSSLSTASAPTTSNNNNSKSSSSSSSMDENDTIEKSRLRLEMMWQLTEAAEDCLVDRPDTCGSQACLTCRGRGMLPCRFCGGTQVLGFHHNHQSTAGTRVVDDAAAAVSQTTTSASAFYACTVCTKGMEPCGACRGTGWVADWTLMLPSTSASSAKSP